MFRADLMISEGVKRAIQAMHDAAIEAVGSGAQPAWVGLVAEVDAKQNAAAFASEGAKSGEKWPDILQGDGNFKQYKKWKSQNYPRRKLNVWNGYTLDSLRTNSHPNRIARMTGNVIELGTNAKLAKKMQFGESHGTWQKAFLRGSSRGTGTMKEMGIRGRGGNWRVGRRHASGSAWFVLWYKSIPARPIVRKSAAQVHNLKLAIAKGVVSTAARIARGTAQGRILATVAAQIRPNPRE